MGPLRPPLGPTSDCYPALWEDEVFGKDGPVAEMFGTKGKTGLAFTVGCRALGLRDCGPCASPFNVFLVSMGQERVCHHGCIAHIGPHMGPHGTLGASMGGFGLPSGPPGPLWTFQRCSPFTKGAHIVPCGETCGEAIYTEVVHARGNLRSRQFT